MKSTPRSTARRSTRIASPRSRGSPQMPRPVIRIAPYPRRVTATLPPSENTPLAAATRSPSAMWSNLSGKMTAMTHENLLGGPPPTYLPDNPEASAALRSGTDPASVAASYPAYCAAWAALAERAMERGDPVATYACARTGYHRGLDQLRRAGWTGYGPIPWDHEPN